MTDFRQPRLLRPRLTSLTQLKPWGIVLFFLISSTTAWAAPRGQIEGRLSDSNGGGLAGILVRLADGSAETLTDTSGRFTLEVGPGNYELELSTDDHTEVIHGIAVPFFGAARVDQVLDWPDSEEIRVAGLRAAADWTPREAAPEVATTRVEGDELAVASSHGQIPRAVASTPGAYAAQQSTSSFQLNARGHNGVSDQRVKVMVDGRDTVEPFFGQQGWLAASQFLGELESVTLTRGPSSAVHGADASGGVLDLVTRTARASQGFRLQLSAGEDDSQNADARWSGALGEGSLVKVFAGFRDQESFSLSRVGQTEYSTPCGEFGDSDCLLLEQSSLDGDESTAYGTVRWDHDFAGGSLFSLETGGSSVEGPVVASKVGRVQILDADHRYSRGRYSSEHWSFFASYKERDADRQRALLTGDNLSLEEETWKAELRTRWALFGDRGALEAGLSHQDEKVDSLDPNGPRRPSLFNGLNQQTLLFEPVSSEEDSLFANVDWRLGDKATLTTAVRYDDSSLYEPQWSSRASLVYAPVAEHTLRLTWHTGYEAPNYADLFLNFDFLPAVNLSFLEPLCAEDGVACGFDIDFLPGEDSTLDTTADTRLLAVGNRDLEVETTETLELGYTGRWSDVLRVHVDFHRSEHEDFITDLLPQLGTSLGRVNRGFGAYEPPEGLTVENWNMLRPLLAAELGDLFNFLTNTVDGTPVVVLRSLTNLGSVDSNGVDVSFDWKLSSGWSLAGSYSWLDFEINQGASGLDDQLRPNVPEEQATLTLAFTGDRWRGRLASRWFDDYRWASGPVNGVVESATVVDGSAEVRLSDHWSLGVFIANLLDEDHYQSFGGDLLRRRALASLSVDW